MAKVKRFTISDTSPAAASTALGDVIYGLQTYDFFAIDANLIGATGGTLDIYLQRRLATNVWVDWLHFPQLGAGDPAIAYCTMSGYDLEIHEVGTGTDAAATPALAANVLVGGHPGDAVRAVYVAGAGTTAGAAVVIRIQAWVAEG